MEEQTDNKSDMLYVNSNLDMDEDELTEKSDISSLCDNIDLTPPKQHFIWRYFLVIKNFFIHNFLRLFNV
jgi:hypothetical protein